VVCVCVCGVCVCPSPDLVMRINLIDLSPTRATRPVSHSPSFINPHNMCRVQIRNIMYITLHYITLRTLPKFCVVLYVLFVLCRSVYCLCVNVYCTTATRWLPNCS
jgi:hypothetical protein